MNRLHYGLEHCKGSPKAEISASQHIFLILCMMRILNSSLLGPSELWKYKTLLSIWDQLPFWHWKILQLLKDSSSNFFPLVLDIMIEKCYLGMI